MPRKAKTKDIEAWLKTLFGEDIGLGMYEVAFTTFVAIPLLTLAGGIDKVSKWLHRND